MTIENINKLRNSKIIKSDCKQVVLNIEASLPIFNLKQISYEALCGNLDNVKDLINNKCNLSVANSSDCNLLTWALLCTDKQARINLVNYLCENKIFDHFNDETNLIIEGIFVEGVDPIKSDIFTSDGLSAYYYFLLSPILSTEHITAELKSKSIQDIVHSNLIKNNTKTSDSNNRRMARYYYIAGYFLCIHNLRELAIVSYKNAIHHWNALQMLNTWDYREIGYVYNCLGKIYYKLSRWKEATECYSMAINFYNKIEEKNLIDHQDLTNCRTNLAGYLHVNEMEINYFNRYQDLA